MALLHVDVSHYRCASTSIAQLILLRLIIKNSTPNIPYHILVHALGEDGICYTPFTPRLAPGIIPLSSPFHCRGMKGG